MVRQRPVIVRPHPYWYNYPRYYGWDYTGHAHMFWWFGPYTWDAPWAYRPYWTETTKVATYDLKAPLGFDKATAAFFTSYYDKTIRVELQKQTPQGLELLILRDDHAGAHKWFGTDRLDEVLLLQGKDREEIIMQYGTYDDKDFRIGKGRFKELYEEFLYPQVRGMAKFEGLW